MQACFVAILILAAPPEGAPAQSCPRLFGTASQRAANAKARTKRLHAVRTRDFSIDLLYSGDWTEPQAVSFANVSVLRAQDGAALVEITADLAMRAGCKERRYTLRADDTLGLELNIIAIVDGIVLLEKGGQLHYTKTRDRDPPVFALTWRATWRMPHSRSTSVAATPAVPPQRPPVRR